MADIEGSYPFRWLGMELGSATGWDGDQEWMTFYDVIPSDLGVQFLFGVNRANLISEMQQLISKPFTLNIDIEHGKVSIHAEGSEAPTTLTSVDWSVAGHTVDESSS